jgi:hypothetical protein
MGQAAVGIVPIVQDFRASLIQLVGQAPVLIVVPPGRLRLAVAERKQVTGFAEFVLSKSAILLRRLSIP